MDVGIQTDPDISENTGVLMENKGEENNVSTATQTDVTHALDIDKDKVIQELREEVARLNKFHIEQDQQDRLDNLYAIEHSLKWARTMLKQEILRDERLLSDSGISSNIDDVDSYAIDKSDTHEQVRNLSDSSCVVFGQLSDLARSTVTPVAGSNFNSNANCGTGGHSQRQMTYGPPSEVDHKGCSANSYSAFFRFGINSLFVPNPAYTESLNQLNRQWNVSTNSAQSTSCSFGSVSSTKTTTVDPFKGFGSNNSVDTGSKPAVNTFGWIGVNGISSASSKAPVYPFGGFGSNKFSGSESKPTVTTFGGFGPIGNPSTGSNTNSFGGFSSNSNPPTGLNTNSFGGFGSINNPFAGSNTTAFGGFGSIGNPSTGSNTNIFGRFSSSSNPSTGSNTNTFRGFGSTNNPFSGSNTNNTNTFGGFCSNSNHSTASQTNTFGGFSFDSYPSTGSNTTGEFGSNSNPSTRSNVSFGGFSGTNIPCFVPKQDTSGSAGVTLTSGFNVSEQKGSFPFSLSSLQYGSTNASPGLSFGACKRSASSSKLNAFSTDGTSLSSSIAASNATIQAANTLFSATATALISTQATNCFGGKSSNLGTGSAAPNFSALNSGSTVKFIPVIDYDTFCMGGRSQAIQTKNMTICAMKEYEEKSMEEIRYEDYQKRVVDAFLSSSRNTTPVPSSDQTTPSSFSPGLASTHVHFFRRKPIKKAILKTRK